MKCPKCGRDTYSKKFDQCTACMDVRRRPDVARETSPFTVTKLDPRDVSFVTDGKRVTKAVVTRGDGTAETFKVGRPPKYASPAERQRAYRARKKAQ